MSGLLAGLTGHPGAPTGTHWLPGSVALVVLATALLLLVLREIARGAVAKDAERRAAVTALLVAPLLLCAALAVGARFLYIVLT